MEGHCESGTWLGKTVLEMGLIFLVDISREGKY